jgi:serine/threonine protein kinase
MEPRQSSGVCPLCGWNPDAGAASVLHLHPGTILHNCYLVGRVLGQGGFGITYIGWDTQLHRKIAVKEYFPQVIASRQPRSSTVVPSTAGAQADFDYGLRSFMSEGRIVARFSDHPCIVSVLNLFEENRTGYLVMVYLDGITLAQSIARAGGKLPYETARDVMMRVMDGLREVHSQGLLHRDISPDNIYLTRQGLVKILDFGAARFEAGERSQSLSVVLKEGYAPEEQYRRSGNQGPWTDVYATAATLYRAITGITPPPALDRRHTDSLESPSQLGVAMPPRAEAALLRALAVSAGDRFQSVEAFQAALGTQGGPPPPPPPPPVPPPYPPPLPPPLPRSSNAKWIVGIILALLIVGLIGASIAYNQIQENARIEAQRAEEQRQRDDADRKQQEDAAAEAERQKQAQLQAQQDAQEKQAVANSEDLASRFDDWMAKRQTELAPQVHTVKLINQCPTGAISVVARFKVPDNTDHWMTFGWWKVDSGQSVLPKLATTKGDVYFYAEFWAGNSNLTWNGSGEADSISVPVVNNKFVHVDGSEIQGRGQKNVTMFHKSWDTWGTHDVLFTCK